MNRTYVQETPGLGRCCTVSIIKTVDPDHLLTTMLAGVDAPTLTAISARAPSHLLSFQLYGEIDQLPDAAAGLCGPTKSPSGVPPVTGKPADWGCPIEATSHGKAEDIARRYRDVILQQRSQCLGLVFLWGQKQSAHRPCMGCSSTTVAVPRRSMLWSMPGRVIGRTALSTN